MSEHQEYPTLSQKNGEGSVKHELAEFEQLDTEWQELAELHNAAKDLLHTGLSSDLVERLPELEQELARVHQRQHEVIDRQAALEISILRAKSQK